MDGQSALSNLKNHVVICNCNEKVAGIVRELHYGSKDEPIDVVLVCADLGLWQNNPDWHPFYARADHFFVVEGNPTSPEELAHVRIDRARAAIILADPPQGDLADARSTLVAVAIERQNPQVHTIIELITSINRVHLKTTEVNEVVCLGELSEKLIAQSCITPGVKNIFHHLLSSNEETNQIFTVPLPETMVGSSFRTISRNLIRLGAPYLLCGIGIRNFGSNDDAKRATVVFVLNPRHGTEPGKDTPLRLGDELVIISREKPELDAFCRNNGGF